MFRKLLSCMTVMIIAFGMNAMAQSLQTINMKTQSSEKQMLPMKSTLTLAEDEFWWGYWDGIFDDNMRLLGIGIQTTIPQQYSACVRIPAGSVIGKDKTIEGIKFSFSDSKNIDNVRIWISNDLPSTIDKASVICQKVEKDKLTGMMTQGDQWNDVRFDKPYAIEADKDVYVGYAFEVIANEGQNDQYPLLVDMASTTQDNAMYLKFTEPSDWTDFKGSQNGDLAIRVLMSGEIENASVGIVPTFDNIYGVKDAEVTIPVKVDNRGVDGFEKLDVTIDVDGKKENKTITPEKKVEGVNKEYTFDVNVKTLSSSGTSNVTITIDKVNGKPNSCAEKTMKGKVITLSRKAKKKVVMEEFTAFWCGACPTGYVGLQKLRNQFGEDISLISLHRNDPIECTDYVDFILATNTVGYPNSHIDRTYMDVYPYVGSGKNGTVGKAGFGGFGLGKDVEKLMEVLPLAEVNVTANIDGDILTAKANTKFLFTGDTNHALAFVVTEDGMQSDSWSQSNYLTDQKGWGWEDEEPLFDMWVNGEKKVKGVVYDDIAVAAQGVMYGIDNSIPSTVVEEASNEFSVEFNLADYAAIQDKSKLNIIAFIIDKTNGRIVNSDYKKIGNDTGIDTVEDGYDAYEVARYTIDGNRIASPQKGVNIVKYSNGKIKKVIVE